MNTNNQNLYPSQPCPLGTYVMSTKRGDGIKYQVECFPCPVGFYCDGRDTILENSMTLCKENHYCPPGSYRPLPCPPVSISANGSGELSACLAIKTQNRPNTITYYPQTLYTTYPSAGVEIAALVFGLLAFVMAVWQFVEMRRLKQRLAYTILPHTDEKPATLADGF